MKLLLSTLFLLVTNVISFHAQPGNDDCTSSTTLCANQSQPGNTQDATISVCVGCSDGATSAGNDRFVQKVNSPVIVSSFLWYASLETISFLPVKSADPLSGVIIGDWYTLPKNPDERYKVDVYVLTSQLRSDGVRVSVFKEQRVNSTWQSTNETNGYLSLVEV